MIAYHCSPAPTLVFAAGRTLCVTDDAAIAAAYRRGGDVPHYLHAIEWDERAVETADEATMTAAWSAIHGREWAEDIIPAYEAAKDRRVRAALIAAGYEAMTYGDTHEGCTYETVEFFRPAECVRVVGVDVVED